MVKRKGRGRTSANHGEATSVLIIVGVVLLFPAIAHSFLCERLEEHNWEALTAAIEASPDFVILCPFEIKGSRCPKSPKGYVVPENSSLIILCDHTAFGGGGDDLPYTESASIEDTPQQENETPTTNPISSCIIDCPGTHFTVQNAALTLDGMLHRGSKTGALVVEANGELHVFESKFQNNSYATSNGGAIQAAENTRLIVNKCEFENNTALNGGAIFVEGQSYISFSKFVDNKALGTTPMSGGGAVAVGVYAETTITGCEFDVNSASSHQGAAVLDHSDGLHTISQANKGCNNRPDAGSEISCNGIQQENTCQEFEVTCAIAASESKQDSPVPPSPSPSPMPTIDPCRDDQNSFECVLHELLEELP